MFKIVDKDKNIIQSFDSVYDAWNVSRIMIASGNDVVVERENGTEVHYNDIYVDDDDFYEDYLQKGGMW